MIQVTRDIGLIDILREDFIETMSSVEGYTYEGAEDLWTAFGTDYLIGVFDDISDRLTIIANKNK